MKGLTCNACNREFEDDAEQKLHYRSEWHRYNLKRKVAGVPGVTESLFQARQLALAEEHEKISEKPMLYCCSLCEKEYRSFKAHSQHLESRMHTMKASQESGQVGNSTIIKHLAERTPNKPTSSNKDSNREGYDEETDESEESEWEIADPNDEMEVSESLNLHVDGYTSRSGITKSEDMDEDEELDVSSCFICDRKHRGIESCMVHMHKKHGFFIPDVEYLKDPTGLLTYVGLKVKRDFTCLYCNERCQPFQSMEAVRKHMIAKGHCKLRYGDGGDDEEGELEDFYDYTSSYTEESGKEIMAANDASRNVELGSGGAELIITQKTDNGTVVRVFGSREFLRYYRQKPRPSRDSNVELAISLASRYRSLGLVTSNRNTVRMKILREMNRSGVEALRSKIGMKSNVIRNLPKNCTY